VTPNPVAAARAFALVAHGDQRYGEYPFIVHLEDVAERAFAWNPEARTRWEAELEAVSTGERG
jgi:hypothetical protein